MFKNLIDDLFLTRFGMMRNVFYEDGGDSGGGDGGQHGDDGQPQSITLADILPTDMMDDTGNYPKSIADFTGVVIPGADKNNPDHQEFHRKIASLTKAYSDTKSMVGGMVKIPGEGATQDEINAFRSKIGVPAAAGDYNITVPEDEISQKFFSDDVLTKFKEEALKAGFTNDHVQMAVNFQSELFGGMIAEAEKSAKDGIDALQKELGDKYDEYIAGAEQMVSKYWPESALDSIKTGIGNDPDFTRGLIEVYKATKEDGRFIDPAGDQNRGTISQLEGEINNLMSSDKYFNNDPATHKQVADLITRKQKLMGKYKESVRSSRE